MVKTNRPQWRVFTTSLLFASDGETMDHNKHITGLKLNKTSAKRPSDTSGNGDFWTAKRHFFHLHRLHMERKQGGIFMMLR